LRRPRPPDELSNDPRRQLDADERSVAVPIVPSDSARIVEGVVSETWTSPAFVDT
jgi:hypothetical protein